MPAVAESDADKPQHGACAANTQCYLYIRIIGPNPIICTSSNYQISMSKHALSIENEYEMSGCGLPDLR